MQVICCVFHATTPVPEIVQGCSLDCTTVVSRQRAPEAKATGSDISRCDPNPYQP